MGKKVWSWLLPAVMALSLFTALSAVVQADPPPALIGPAETRLTDFFPQTTQGENGIYLQARDEAGTYHNLDYISDYNFQTTGAPWGIPKIYISNMEDEEIGAEPSAINQLGVKKDCVIRTTLNGDYGWVRVTGTAQMNNGSARFYIYKGETGYDTPLWEAAPGATPAGFDLPVPYTEDDLLFFATDAGGSDVDDWAVWDNIRFIAAPAPVLQSAATNAAGEAVILTFDQDMADPSGKEAQFTVTVNESGNTVTASALGTDTKTIELTLTTPVIYGQTVTVSYTQGTVTASDGGVLASFTDYSVTNNAPFDTDGDGYHDGDVAILTAFLEQESAVFGVKNGAQVVGPSYNSADPSTFVNSYDCFGWSGSPKRLTRVSFGVAHGYLPYELAGTFDARPLAELTELDIQGTRWDSLGHTLNDGITAIEVSGLTRLENLYCGNNNITELDLTGLSALETLSCEGNELTFSSLPVFDGSYSYAPQQPVLVKVEFGNAITLSSEASILAGRTLYDTTFRWYDDNGTPDNPADDSELTTGVTESPAGEFTFDTAIHGGKSVYCVMTNPLFPDFAGGNTLKTAPAAIQACVAAIGATQYPTLAAALTAVTDGQTIVLLNDVTYNGTIEVSTKSFTIDLNGSNLSMNTGAAAIAVSGGKSLTITDTDSSVSPGSFSCETAGTPVISVSGSGSAVDIDVPATLTATGYGSYGIFAQGGGTVEITANSQLNCMGYYGICAQGSESKVDFKGNVTQTNNVNGIGVYADYNAIVNVDGSVAGCHAGAVAYAATINVTGSATAAGPGIYGVFASQEGGTVRVEGDVSGGRYGVYAVYGGEIVVDEDCTAAGDSSEYPAAAWADGVGSTVVIGGDVTFNGSQGCGVRAQNGGEITVSGDVTANGADVYGAWVYGDSRAIVTVEGRIGATKYVRIADTDKNKNEYFSVKDGYYIYYIDGAEPEHVVQVRTGVFAWVVDDNGAGLPVGPATVPLDTGPVVSISSGGPYDWYITGADFVGGTLYGVSSYSDDSGLYTIDARTGAFTQVGHTGKALTGFAYDTGTGIAYASTVDKLYTINLETAGTTLVGPFGTGVDYIVGIATDNDGNMYGIDIMTDSLYLIDTVTGAAALIGGLGIDISYAQDIAYDRDNGVLYGALYNNSSGSGGLYVIDTATGAAVLKYSFTAELDGFAIPYDALPDTDAPVLTAGAVYRTSATSTTVRFVSDTAGTYYYLVTNSAAAPSTDDLSGWTSGAAVTADTAVAFSPAGLAAGAKYVHIVVRDSSDNVSEALTAALPYDLYYFDDFESYPTDSYPAHYFSKYAGAGPEFQKIVGTDQADGTMGYVFSLKGTSGEGSHQCIELPEGITGVVTLEFDVMKDSASGPDGQQACALLGQTGVQYVGGIACLSMHGGLFYPFTDNASFISTYTTAYELDNWHHVVIELDYTNRTFNYYVDGGKVNSDAMDAHPTYVLDYFGLVAGGIVAYFDNVKVYNGPAEGFYALTGPEPIAQNDVTAAVAFSPSNTVAAGTDITATVTLSGTAAAAGTHTVDLTSVKASLATNPQTAAVTAGQDLTTTPVSRTFTFTMPSEAVDDFVLTHTFEAAGPATVSITAIPGVTPPVRGATPVSAITETEQYTGAVAWSPAHNPFKASTVYTATINLMAKAGYTFTGVAADSFTVAGADSVSNPANSGVVTAVFPSTGAAPGGGGGGGGGVISTYYTVSASQSVGGVIALSKTRAAAGDSVTAAITPDPGYEVTDVLVNGKSVGAVTEYTIDNIKTEITVSAVFAPADQEALEEPSSDATPDAWENPFSDVTPDDWYYEAVRFIAERDITKGTGDGKFSPDAKLTRGEFIVLLMRAYEIAPDGNPTGNFADAGDTWYTGYLAAAKRLGISAGVGGNMFAPTKVITRQEMFTLLYNALKALGQLPEGDSGKTLAGFSDAGQVAPWATEAMTLLVETGTISGSGGRLNPNGATTRAEMAQVLYNLLGK